MKMGSTAGMMSVRAVRLSVAAIGTLLVCAGCGFKGPLYLPERNGTVVTRPGQTGQAAPTGGQTQASPARNKSKTSSSPPPPQNSGVPQSPPPQSQ